MTSKKTYYWDSCAWIGLLNREPGKITALSAIWQHAQDSRCRILTSTISVVEVLKKKCDDQDAGGLSRQQNANISKMFQQPHVVMADVDLAVATRAAELRLQHRELKKTPDAIHVATAMHWNCDAMHTYDENDLLPLTGKVFRRDGVSLAIERPDAAGLGPLFSQGTSEDDERP